MESQRIARLFRYFAFLKMIDILYWMHKILRLQACCVIRPLSQAKVLYGGKMAAPLSATAQRIQDLLAAKGYGNTVVEFADSTRTAQEAADRAGCQLGQITKSLIFRGRQTGKAILVLTSGANRVDETRIAQYAGEPIGRAEPEFVREVTGFSIGGVPPVGHAHPVQTYLDEDLLLYETIWAAAGTPNAIFELTPADLQSMTGGRPVRVK
jgi:prolyl-tRNA editing enzyme YbaK/EbsC (Cys-tRNA(Pro) deacylase)